MIKRDKKGRFLKGNNGWLGKHHTDETKEKIRKFHIGRKLSEKHRKSIKNAVAEGKCGFKKGHPLFSKGFTGKKHSEETKQKQREANLRLGIKPPQYKGKDNSNWRGGISREPYDFNFDEELKILIRKRDKYHCRLCKKKFKVLYVHHIDYNKKNSDPKNLISLCNSCHSKTNYGRKKWTNYFQNEGDL